MKIFAKIFVKIFAKIFVKTFAKIFVKMFVKIIVTIFENSPNLLEFLWSLCEYFWVYRKIRENL